MTKTTISTIGLLALAASIGYSQNSQTPPPAAITAPAATTVTAPELRPVTIGVDAGTTGFGGQLGFRFADHFGARAGVDYFSYSDHATIQGIQYSASLQFLTEPVTLDWYPWVHHSFHISVGALFNENEVSGSASGTVTINGTPYMNSTVDLKIQQQVVDPYLSIGGCLYFDRAHHWSLGGELGTFWSGDPRVSLTANSPGLMGGALTTFNSNVQAEQAKVKHYARDAAFWPVLKLSLNYSF